MQCHSLALLYFPLKMFMCYLVSFLLLAMTPADIKDFFVPVFKQAQVLREAYNTTNEEKRRKIKMPFVTVSLL